MVNGKERAVNRKQRTEKQSNRQTKELILNGSLPALRRRRLLTPAKMRSGLAVIQAGTATR
jgi:hypothetical protein